MLNEIIDLYGIIIAKVLLIATIYNLGNKEISFKSIEFYLCLLFCIVVQLITYEFDLVLMPLINFITIFTLCWFILKQKFKENILLPILICFLMITVEILILGIMLIFLEVTTLSSAETIMNMSNNNMIYSFTINILAFVLVYLISRSRTIKKCLNKINSYFSSQNFFSALYIFMIIFMLIAISYEIVILSENLLVIIGTFIVLYTLIIFLTVKDLKVGVEYSRAKEKYNSISNSLIEYEDMIDKYRVNNHENKNHLKMIRNMIEQNDKNVCKYIDNLLDTVYMKNEALMMDVSIIPAGGIRATVYSKLVIMDNKQIKHILNIDHQLRSVDYFEEDADFTIKICNLLSIFLDNAIDEICLLDDKMINIDIYMDSDVSIVFEITNKCARPVEIDKIYNKKYTTKSNGHGYGLALAKEIIDSDFRIINIPIYEDNLFTQKLIINIKK